MTFTNKKNCQSCGSVVGLTMMYCPSCGSASFNSGTQQSPVAPTDSIKQTSSHPHQSQSLKPTLSVHQTPINQASSAALHPWRRLFARLFDLILHSFIQNFFIFYTFPQYEDYATKFFIYIHDLQINFIFIIIIIIIYAFLYGFVFLLLIEAFCLYAFGSTIGKALYGIQINRNVQRVSFGSAFHRTFLNLLHGQALWMPPIFLISWAFAYVRLKKTGTTSWDANLGWTVSHTKLGGIRWIAILLSWTAVLTVIGVTIQMADR